MENFKNLLKEHGVGRRSLNCIQSLIKPPPRLCLIDLDEEILCHDLNIIRCHVPGCRFECETLLEFEGHYNSLHRYMCSQCNKKIPSSHLLDLHLQETHDSFFAVASLKNPLYRCYIEECDEKFLDTEKRLKHGCEVHGLPKDYRFDNFIGKLKKKNKKKRIKQKHQNNMDCDIDNILIEEALDKMNVT